MQYRKLEKHNAIRRARRVCNHTRPRWRRRNIESASARAIREILDIVQRLAFPFPPPFLSAHPVFRRLRALPRRAPRRKYTKRRARAEEAKVGEATGTNAAAAATWPGVENGSRATTVALKTRKYFYGDDGVGTFVPATLLLLLSSSRSSLSLSFLLVFLYLSLSRPLDCPALSPVSPTSRFRPSRRAPTFALFLLPPRGNHPTTEMLALPRSVISRVRAVDMNRWTFERVFVRVRDFTVSRIYDLRESLFSS